MKPKRHQLHGYSPSEFKTMLRRKGHKVSRNFFKRGCVSEKSGTYFRWRWWNEDGFMVDLSCPKAEFDHWANSTDVSATVLFFIKEKRKVSKD